FLFNLEVQVTQNAGVAAGPVVAAKGLNPAENATEKLSYTAPSDSGGVEVRNQRGQIQQSATDRSRRAETAAPAEEAATAGRGAFGQSAAGESSAAPVNRAERRATPKKK
ncbi:MAG: preprotein translocase subunit SecA, partial [Cryobacterium sp.]